ARRVRQAPYLAVRIRHTHGGKLLAADREIPFSTGIVVAAAGGVVGPWAGPVAYFRGISGKLRAEVWVLLVPHLTIHNIRSGVHELLIFLSRHDLDVLEGQVTDIGLSKRRIVGIVAG